MVPRTIYALSSLIGVMILFLYINFKVDIRIEKLIIAVSIIYIGIQYLNFQKIITDRYIINFEDRTIAMSIKNKIEENKKNTLKNIENIVLCNDKSVMYTYQGLFRTGNTIYMYFLKKENSYEKNISYYTNIQ